MSAETAPKVSRRTGKPVRVQMDTRVAPAAREHIEGRAVRASAREGRVLTRSDMARRMLAYAAQHMPESWVPPGEK